MELSFPEFEKGLSKRIEETQDYVYRFMRRKVQEKLNEWATRYPRHQFKAWDDYGCLILEVHPPLSGDTFYGKDKRVSWASKRHKISTEAEALENYWMSFDNNIGPHLTKPLLGRN